ncbi:MAG TPA: chemotaxis protein CheW [Bacteroidota bacterium]|nr:chemotaxis protein CheW [Bacteroidota bacterium]
MSDASTVTHTGQANADELLQLVSFKVGEEEFGIEILKVQEIIRMAELTRVPNAPPHVEGIINLRGKVIPVLSLRSRLGMPPKENDRRTRTVVVEVSGRVVGFVVDAMSEVLRIPKGVTEPPPSIVGGIDTDFITAIGKLDDRLLTLLDIEKVLAS